MARNATANGPARRPNSTSARTSTSVRTSSRTRPTTGSPFARRRMFKASRNRVSRPKVTRINGSRIKDSRTKDNRTKDNRIKGSQGSRTKGSHTKGDLQGLRVSRPINGLLIKDSPGHPVTRICRPASRREGRATARHLPMTGVQDEPASCEPTSRNYQRGKGLPFASIHRARMVPQSEETLRPRQAPARSPFRWPNIATCRIRLANCNVCGVRGPAVRTGAPRSQMFARRLRVTQGSSKQNSQRFTGRTRSRPNTAPCPAWRATA